MELKRAAASQIDEKARNFDELAAVIKVSAATLALLLFAATVLWEIAHHLPMPIQDDIFDRLRFYRAMQSGPLALFEYFISPHNEHRIMTTRLVADFDELVFSGREYTQLILINVLQVACCVVSYRFAFWSDIGRNWDLPQRMFVFATLLLLFINPCLYYTLLVAFQLQHTIMEFLSVIAAVIVADASGKQLSSAEQRRLILWLIFLAVIGTFTLGNAPALLIAAASTAVVLRWNRRLTLILIVLAVVHTVAVLATTQPVGTRTHNLLLILKFALIYWGSPFLRFEAWPAGQVIWWTSVDLAGSFGVIVLLTPIMFAIARFLKPGLGGRLAVFGFVVLVIVVTTGVAAGLSRGQFGVLEGANKKYASFGALGWLGVPAVLAGLAHERFPRIRRPETAVFAVLFAVLMPLSASGYTRETRIWQKMIDVTWEQSLAVFLHVNERYEMNSIYNDAPGLAEYVHDVQPKDRSIFSLFPFRWGDNVQKLLAGMKPSPCRSEVQTVTPVPAADYLHIFNSPGNAVTISGWAWMEKDHAPPAYVVAVDSGHRIVGVARFTRTSGRAEEWLGQKFYQNLGWYGYARLTEPPPLSFFAISAGGRHYCALGGLGNAQ